MTQEERNSSPFSSVQDARRGGGRGNRGAPSQTTCLSSEPQSARDRLRAPGFALTLSEDAHRACFTGRILEAGVSLQARAGDSCSRVEFRPDGKGPQARGQATSGRKAASGGPGRWLSFPGGSFSICDSEKGRQPWAEGPGTALPKRSQAGRTRFWGKQLNPNQTPFPGKSIPARSC